MYGWCRVSLDPLPRLDCPPLPSGGVTPGDDEVDISFAGGETLPGRIYRRSPEADLALIDVPKTGNGAMLPLPDHANTGEAWRNEVQFVPGLLQTADYARAVIKLGQPGASAAEIERRVSLRMSRQELLSKPEAPRLWAVVDEAAPRRPIGGREVMRAQLERLIEVTREPNITLCVVPVQLGRPRG